LDQRNLDFLDRTFSKGLTYQPPSPKIFRLNLFLKGLEARY
jgi:hypothetical protein